MAVLRGVDLGRALLALALAFVLWWVISAEQRPERIDLFPSPIPVEVVNAPPNMVVAGEVPSIQVQVRAPSDVWSRLRSSSFRATADAARASPGTNELAVRLESLDQEVRSAEPVPPAIRVNMEELRERVVPVRVNLTGAVPFGYSSGQARVVPETITAIGPASVVTRVQEALVELPLDQLTLSVNNTYQPVPVDARRERVSGIRLNPATVSVEVPIAQSVTYKEVGIRPVIRGRLKPGYYLEPVEVNPPSVTVVGEPAALAGITSVETEPVDITDLAATVVRQVALRAPARASILQTQNRPVSVTLRVSPLQTTQTLQITPTVVGLRPELALAEPPGLVELTITGPAPILQGLKPQDFRVVLDLSSAGAGTQEIEPRVELPSGFQLVSLNPARVRVTIRPAPGGEGS